MCALKIDHDVQCWGSNDSSIFNIPTEVNNVVKVKADMYYVCVIKSDTTVVCW